MIKNIFVCLRILCLLAFSALFAEADNPFGLEGKVHSAPSDSTDKSIGNKFVSHKDDIPHLSTILEEKNISSSDSSKQKVSSYSLNSSAETYLYAYLKSSCDNNHPKGWYGILSDNINQLWIDPFNTEATNNRGLQTSWVKDGRLCGFDNLYKYGYLWGQTYYEVDISTGQIICSSDDLDCIYEGGVFLSACYDPEENVVYGYASDDYESESISKGIFQKTTNYPFGYEVIKTVASYQLNTICMAMAYNPIDKGIYGITLNCDLVKVDKDTGEQYLIAHLNTNALKYFTGMCFSTIENKWLWNPVYSDTSSAIVSIDPVKGEISDLLDFTTGGERFGCLVELGSTVSGDSPMAPSIESIDFEAGATSGIITYILPSYYLKGSPIEGELNWYSMVDNNSYSSGIAKAGQKIKVTFTNLTPGIHTFTLYVEIEDLKSAETSISFYVGSDCPSQPQNVVLTSDDVHWSSVETGANGEEINVSELVYDVYIDGELVTTTPLTYYDVTLGEGKPFALHQASVVAKIGRLSSIPGVSNRLAAGDAWELPYDLIASQETYQLCKVCSIDNDTDDNTFWNINSTFDFSSFYSGESKTEPGDDWIFLPPVNLSDIECTYALMISAKCFANLYPDSHLEVCIGTHPEPSHMNQVIIEDFVPIGDEYDVYENPMFMISESGTYYIGLHARTGIGKCGVMVNEINVRRNDISSESPAPVSNLNAVAGASGALNATVSFTMPTLSVNGSLLPSDAQLIAKVIGANTFDVEGKPGEAVSVVVPTMQGDNKISVVIIYHGKYSESQSVGVYTGVSIPGCVKDLSAEVNEDMMGCEITWTVPDALSDGYVDPETIDYYLITLDSDDVVKEEYIGTGICKYNYILPSGALQNIYRIGIRTSNVAGNSDTYSSITAVMGTPYGLPMSDDFEAGNFRQTPWIQYDESNVEWFLYPKKNIAAEWKDLPGVALCGVGKFDSDDESTYALPRFSTYGQEEIKFVITSWTGEQAANTSIKISAHGTEEPEIIGYLGYSDSNDLSMWKTHEFIIPSKYLNRSWVELSLNSKFSMGHNYVIIDEVTVKGNNDTGAFATWFGEGSILGGLGCIKIHGFDNQMLSIYSMDGRKVNSFIMTGSDKSINVSSGIYIVKVGNKSIKLIVR